MTLTATSSTLHLRILVGLMGKALKQLLRVEPGLKARKRAGRWSTSQRKILGTYFSSSQTVIDSNNLHLSQIYQILISGIVPRPVAFVSSVSASGVANIAPFSWFNQVSPFPAVLSVSCNHSASGAKDTVRNIKETNQFTVNIISEPWIEQADACSIDAPKDVSEWDFSGLTKADCVSRVQSIRRF